MEVASRGRRVFETVELGVFTVPRKRLERYRRRQAQDLPYLGSACINTHMTLKNFNSLSFEAAYAELQKCCGAKNWVKRMLDIRPFASSHLLFEKADTIWNGLSPSDWKEAFSYHPKIGELKKDNPKMRSTASFAQQEQSLVKSASSFTLNELLRLNIEYEKKFGYIFIVCATGKTAE